jgi:hydrogenase nickel incorporation protein HypA/HybF
MHELSIAMAIVDAAVEESDRRGGVRITQVHLKIGLLAGVVKEALLSSYEMAAAEMPVVAGSQLVIEEVPVMILCPQCKQAQPVMSMQLMHCMECGTPSSEIVAGRELEVVAMEIVE